MRAIILLVIGTVFLLNGILTIIALILTLTINKDSRLYKYLTKPGQRGIDKYLKKKFSEKTNRIIGVVVGIVFGIATIALGLNILLKGIIDPYGSGFWILF